MNTITENNKLLAEFMGLIKSSTTDKYWTNKSLEGFGVGELLDLQFHSDWNWLMEVVEKIESLGFKFNITTSDATALKNHGAIYQTLIYRIDGPKKIDAVYKTCVEFVKWYNDQKTN